MARYTPRAVQTISDEGYNVVLGRTDLRHRYVAILLILLLTYHPRIAQYVGSETAIRVISLGLLQHHYPRQIEPIFLNAGHGREIQCASYLGYRDGLGDGGGESDVDGAPEARCVTAKQTRQT
jgi:hypothetical protein